MNVVAMINELIRHFPSRRFCAGNVLFWLILNTLAADHTHRTRLFYGRESHFFETWLEYLPWWGNWALVAPFVVAAIHSIKLEENRLPVFVAKNVILMVVSMFVYWGLTVLEVGLFFGQTGEKWGKMVSVIDRLLVSPMHLDFLVYLAVACLGFTMRYYARSKQQAVDNQKLANQLLKVELQSLKSQLSPHFLFNTLNTISGLVRLDDKRSAVQALSELSKMFRKVLENQKNQLTSLATEMDFINSYLSIQKMRFESKLAFEINVVEKCLEAELPFMLLHTLVENAVQHGSQLESNKNLLKLSISQLDTRLCIELTNKVCQNESHKGFGIGLKNCRQRLQHIYGNNYHLNCEETEEGYFVTKLVLPMDRFDA